MSTKPDDVARVRVSELVATSRDATITVRGRTQAMHEVDVRAEVEGVVQAIHFDKGDKVKAGDVLCEIKLNDRGAKAAQAAALVAQTLKELQVAQDLYAQGFRSKTQLAQSEAAYAQAQAGLSTMQIQLANTRIRAPFDGFVDDRYVNAGDYMRPGDKCELVIAPEPFLAVGTVSEHEVGEITRRRHGQRDSCHRRDRPGKGHIRRRPRRSDDAHLPRRSTTAQSRRQAARRRERGHSYSRETIESAAHLAGILVLDDSGAVGVRAVIGGMVRFIPIQILSDGPDGMWVSGLPDRVSVITVGQEFVTNGERVKTVPDKGGVAT